MRSFSNRRVTSLCLPRQSKFKHLQGGVGLIEVLIALFILAIGALAIANLQTASNVAMQNSADYFKLNELSFSVIEQLKADSVNAGLGDYNTTYAETTAKTTAPADVSIKVNAWKNTAAYILPLGEMQIDCAATECLVSLRWHETAHSGTNEQVYNIRSPI